MTDRVIHDPGDVGARLTSVSSALGALATGFAAGAALTGDAPRLRNANAGLALALGIASAAIRIGVKDGVPNVPHDAPIATLPSNPEIDYSIIVPVYNRPNLISNLLGVLRTQAHTWVGEGRGEIVVVDDGSADETVAVATAIASTMPLPTRVVSIPHSGPGAARNAGFAAARGRIGVSIDSDCVPHADWLPGLLAEVRDRPMAAAFARVCAHEHLAYPIENAPDSKGFVSASFALDRSAFCQLGGFFPSYGMSHEDLDFVQVAREAGYEVIRAHSHIDHPMRVETAKSIWRVGLNSKYANLFVRRHGRRASGITRTTPYYFFGIAGNYGSSIAFVTFIANALATMLLAAGDDDFRADEFRLVSARLGLLSLAYVAALAALGLRVGAGSRLPQYVSTLATFQFATLIGRLRGSYEYGSLLL